MTVESWPQFTAIFSMKFCLMHTSRQAVFSFITSADQHNDKIVHIDLGNMPDPRHDSEHLRKYER